MTAWLAANVLPWLVAGGLALAAIFERDRRKAAEKRADDKDADYENAEDIRRRVSTDRAAKLRELDDAGYRD